jgi:hypothetical protein
MNKYLINANDDELTTKANKLLKDDGIVQIRGLFDINSMHIVNNKLTKIFKNPTLGGSIGYTQKDPHKKVYDALLVGQETVDLVLNKKIINIAKKFFSGEPILSHAYIKKNLGFNDFFFPYHSHTGSDRDLILPGPYGLAMIAYLHDTDEGCFLYSPGTHKLKSPHGGNPYIYPEGMKKEVFNKQKRMIGNAGDIIIFDEAGFHGPENPCKKDRLTIMFEYQRSEDFGNKVRHPAPCLPHTLGKLNKEQLTTLGVGRGKRNEYEDFHLRTYNQNKNFIIMKSIFIFGYKIELFMFKIKYFVKKLLNKAYK